MQFFVPVINHDLPVTNNDISVTNHDYPASDYKFVNQSAYLSLQKFPHIILSHFAC